MNITAEMIKALRAETNAGVLDCRKALQESNGDHRKALAWLQEKGMALAANRAERIASNGAIEIYSHGGGRVGVMVEVNCETDFVARTDDFQSLAKDLALHITSANPMAVSADDLPEAFVAKERKIIEEQVAESGKPEAVRDKIVEGKLKKLATEYALLDQPFVKDDKRTVGEVIKSVSATVGENIVVKRFVRYAVGDA